MAIIFKHVIQLCFPEIFEKKYTILHTLLSLYFALYISQGSISSKGGISSISSVHGESDSSTLCVTKSGRDFGGLFGWVMWYVVKAVSANTEKASVACDRLDWISFALGIFFTFGISSVASSLPAVSTFESNLAHFGSINVSL